MPNLTAGMNSTSSNGGSGTRAAGGTDIWSASPMTVQPMTLYGSTFTQFDINDALTATQDDLDLAALNLDSSGSKNLTGLYGEIFITYISGTGSVLCAPGTTNGATWVGTATIGGGATHTRQHKISMTVGATTTGALKTIDLTVAGSIVYSVRVYAGTSTTGG